MPEPKEVSISWGQGSFFAAKVEASASASTPIVEVVVKEKNKNNSGQCFIKNVSVNISCTQKVSKKNLCVQN